MLKRSFAVLISICIIISAFPLGVANAETEDQTARAVVSEYLGPYVTVGNVTLPMKEHMPGTFFTKNGKACTCHNTSSNYCIQSVGNCNCMRYYPTGDVSTCEVDLLGAQCFAFSRLIFYKCFGFIDHSGNSSLYYSVGSLSRGSVNANSIKELMMKAAPGAHIRLAKGHSVSILTMDNESITIYHANAGGDNVVSQPCVVSTRRFTWQEFADYSLAGVQYVNMPYNYPSSSGVVFAKEGFYKLTSDVNLRADTSTQSEVLAVVPNSTILDITEVDGYWGKTQYNGKEGWVYLLYSTLYSQKTLTPSGNSFVLDETGNMRSIAWQTDLDSLDEYFPKHSLVVTDSEGMQKTGDQYIATGDTLSLTINGETLDSAIICLAGDVNANGRLDVGDYMALKRYIFGTYKLNDMQIRAGDINANGSIDATDYTLIKRYFFSQSEKVFADFMKLE